MDNSLSVKRANYITAFLEQYFDEIAPMDFYRFIFPLGSFEKKGVFETGKYNGILREITNDYYTDENDIKHRKVNRYVVTDDLQILSDVIERNTDEFVILQPLSFVGKSAIYKNARDLYALAIDLDGINIEELGDRTNGLHELIYQLENSMILPKPTFIVMSGTGLHLYFVMEEPIPLYPEVVEELTKMKDTLTDMFWYGSISSLDDNVQYEPIQQPFRVVGTCTKLGTKVRAFVYTGERVSLDYINSFIPDNSRANIKDALKKPHNIKENSIATSNKRGHWIFKKDVYYNWLELLRNDKKHFVYGNRYWGVFILCATARKCNIPFDELEQDAYSLIPILNNLSETYPFTEDDVAAAFKGYSEKYFTLSVDFINHKCKDVLHKTKRNYRKQEQHLQLARGIRELKEQMGESVSGGGRPTKQEQVKEWRALHPEGKKIECERALGLSRHTVLKWWND